MDVSRKNRSVAWFVSHCQTPSQREWFVDALSRHIDVDVYGNCGGLNCDAEGRCPRASYDLLRDHYRFYLSFENSLCTDYVTEKLFRPMTYDVVPIVYGGADYAQYLPEHSFINIRDFRSPQSLAQHLHQLMADDEQYLKYFLLYCRSCGRAVKAIDLKSISLWERRFESCQLRSMRSIIFYNNFQTQEYLSILNINHYKFL